MSRMPQFPEAHEHFLKGLHAHHADHFRVLDAAVDLCDAFVDATRGTTERSQAMRALFVLFGRMYNSLTVATLVLKEGYGVEGGMLTRAFLESYFNIRYILAVPAAEREALAERFFAYPFATSYLNLNRHLQNGYQPKRGEKAKAKKLWQEHWVRKYGWDAIPNKLDWSGLKLEDKAKAGGDALTVYNWLNRHLSEMVHGGPDAWMHYYNVQDEKLTFRIGPTDNDLIDFPVPALSFCTGDIVHDLAELLDLPELMQKAKETINFANSIVGPKKVA